MGCEIAAVVIVPILEPTLALAFESLAVDRIVCIQQFFGRPRNSSWLLLMLKCLSQW